MLASLLIEILARGNCYDIITIIEENYLLRQAVGAIIRYQGNYILIHKVKIMEKANSPVDIEGEWDFVKGGIMPKEKSKEKALFRELKEETGSINFSIVKEYSEKLRFVFPKEVQQTGFTHQETTMFLVEFNGDLSDLKPPDQEIDQIALFSKEEVYNTLFHLESKEFFQQMILEK
ncbi:NUDIX domain-containing protein [Candidatus Hodarchaeum mangrovi]